MGCDGIWDGTDDPEKMAEHRENNDSRPTGFQILDFLYFKIFNDNEE